MKVNLNKQIRKLMGAANNDYKIVCNQDDFYKKSKKLFFYFSKETTDQYLRVVDYTKEAYRTTVYSVPQIENKLTTFINKNIGKNPAPTKDDIQDFINNVLLKNNYLFYLFRLNNFELTDEDISIGDKLFIKHGYNILKSLKESKYFNRNNLVIRDDDILLEVKVVGDLNENSYEIAYTLARKFSEFISFINKLPCEVTELNTREEDRKNIVAYQLEDSKVWDIINLIEKDSSNERMCSFDITNKFYKRWDSFIIDMLYGKYSEMSELKRQSFQAISWIGKSLLDTDETQSYIELIIALETLVEIDPEKLKQRISKDFVNKDIETSIESQIISVMKLLSISKNNQDQTIKAIKKDYDLRSKIMHSGIILVDSFGDEESSWSEVLSRLYDHLFTMICTILFENKWETKYELWKEANLRNKI